MLDSGLRGPGLRGPGMRGPWVERSWVKRAGRFIVLCSWSERFNPTVPLSTQKLLMAGSSYQGSLMKCRK